MSKRSFFFTVEIMYDSFIHYYSGTFTLLHRSHVAFNINHIKSPVINLHIKNNITVIDKTIC